MEDAGRQIIRMKKRIRPRKVLPVCMKGVGLISVEVADLNDFKRFIGKIIPLLRVFSFIVTFVQII